ncbi:MAG: hypothetical protein LBS10_11720 [Gracilibacteraceae bacterium]|jgi:hypothetical protein|nr:hypothetical protein [Gracilibacteraceae bacterium]
MTAIAQKGEEIITDYQFKSIINREVFLFGHCRATEEIARYLLARGVRPAAILDNSTAKQGLACRGVPIAPPERIRDYTAHNSVVLIASRFRAEMAAQLRRLGYDGEIVQLGEDNSFAEFSLSADTLARKTARMRRGAARLEQIRARYPGRRLIICPYNALGDVYWAMAFLPAYRAKHGIGPTALIVAGDACRQVAEMFGAENPVTLEQADMDELVQAVVFTRATDCLIAHHDRPYTDDSIRWLDRHFLSFIDCYKHIVYGLDKTAAPVPPSRLAEFEQREKILPGRSVILAPYAKSVADMPADFWRRMVAAYRRRGYAVFTNTAGRSPAAGTHSLEIPLAQIVAAAEYAGAFVGVRSGLCDVLYTARCRKTVVFPDCYYSGTPYKVADFFALPGWERIVGYQSRPRAKAARLTARYFSGAVRRRADSQAESGNSR